MYYIYSKLDYFTKIGYSKKIMRERQVNTILIDDLKVLKI